MLNPALPTKKSVLVEPAMHLLRLELNLPRVEAYITHRCKFPVFDLRHNVHAALRALGFSKENLPVFSIERQKGDIIPILGYSSFDAARATQALQMSPDIDGEIFEMIEVVGDAVIIGKPMPIRWSKGDEFRFVANVCPTRRQWISRTTKTLAVLGDETAYQIEYDAYKAELRINPQATYHDAYTKWISERLGQAASVIECFTRKVDTTPMLRRTQENERQFREAHLPDAHLEGYLRVEDPGKLRALMLSGVGRHKCFGFGMLKVFV